MARVLGTVSFSLSYFILRVKWVPCHLFFLSLSLTPDEGTDPKTLVVRHSEEGEGRERERDPVASLTLTPSLPLSSSSS